MSGQKDSQAHLQASRNQNPILSFLNQELFKGIKISFALLNIVGAQVLMEKKLFDLGG